MSEDGSGRLWTLVPFTGEFSASEMRNNLPDLVSTGEVRFYIRVPAGKAVYADGAMSPEDESTGQGGGWSHRARSFHDRSRILDAWSLGIPVVEYPSVVRDAYYVELKAKDARLLLELGRVDVQWFCATLQLSPKGGLDAKHLTRRVPFGRLCCLRPDDGQRKTGPWIGDDPLHAVTIQLSDIFVEKASSDGAMRAREDPLMLRASSPGLRVLYLAAAHFYVLDRGIQASQATIQEWVRNEAKTCGLADWLFKKEVLKQVRKLINTKHPEHQGGATPPVLDLSVLSDKEARDRQLLPWVSDRLMLSIHAARHWRECIHRQSETSWDKTDPDSQILAIRSFGKTLESWGFNTSGERDAVLSLAIYPNRLSNIRARLKATKEVEPKKRL